MSLAHHGLDTGCNPATRKNAVGSVGLRRPSHVGLPYGNRHISSFERNREIARASAFEDLRTSMPRPEDLISRNPSPLLGPGGKSNGSSQAAGKMRKTKLVATIGPATCTREKLFQLADAGMSVVRLNMSHGDHKSHKAVIDLVKDYNALGRNCLALMLDTKGPEVRSGDILDPIEMNKGQRYVFSTDQSANGANGKISVNYDGFYTDVGVGDVLLVDGGIISFKVKEKRDGCDVVVEVMDGGVMQSRRHLNVRGKSATLPAITDKDWLDLQFGVENEVDYFALSFVQDASVIHEVKEWLAKRNAQVGVLAKIESAASVQNLEGILDAVDGAMVARGDLGAELALEEVPYYQAKIVQGCRQRGKPVIVATNMLESMITNPAPTRAEVSDIAIAVREGADAVMLSGETAYGRYPIKALQVQSTVALRSEELMTQYKGIHRHGHEEAPGITWITPHVTRADGSKRLGMGTVSEMFAYHAATMANTMGTSLLVFTRQGNMPVLLSHYRPDHPIFAFTDNELVQRRLALYHGVVPLKINFRDTAEATFDAALRELVQRGHIQEGQQVAIVQSGAKPIWRSASMHSIQVRRVEKVEDANHEPHQEPSAFMNAQEYLKQQVVAGYGSFVDL